MPFFSLLSRQRAILDISLLLLFIFLFNYELHYVFLFFLVLSVCEGSLGLSIFVGLVMIIFSLIEYYNVLILFFIPVCFFGSR
jgi:hypothetical protein